MSAPVIDEYGHVSGVGTIEDVLEQIGGVVLRKFGRLRKRGDTVSLERFDFQVLHADSRRIRLLQLHCR